MKKQVLSLSLALLIGVGAISGCTTTPMPNKPEVNTPNTKPEQNDSAVKPPAQEFAPNTEALKSELAGALEDEAIFADSETLLSDNSFSTKLFTGEEEETKEGEVRMTQLPPNEGMAPPPPPKNAPDGMIPPFRGGEKAKEKRDLNKEKRELNKEKLGELKAKRDLRRDEARQNAKKMRTQLEASGAIKVNEDGTITVDPKKVKEAMVANKEQIKARIEKNKEKMKELKEVAKEKFEKLRRKNNVVRNSDVVTTENADGSVTRTMTVEFKNEKAGVTRKNVVTETKKDGKLVSADHSMEMTGKGFSKKVTRVVTVNADGTRNVKLEAVTTWEDGRKRERVEERVFNADGSFVGTGKLTITDKEGKTRTVDLNSSGSAKGEVSTSAVDPETKTEVKIEESKEGEATLVVAVEGKGEVSEEIETEEEN